MPKNSLEKIAVKIDGPRLMDVPDGFIEVEFNELEIFLYTMNGTTNIGARAKGISPVKTK